MSPVAARIRVLLAEDSADDAKLVVRALERGGFDVGFERVASAAAMSDALARGGWDAVLADYNMPGFSGLEALDIARRAGLDIPFILVSGAVGEALAVAAMKAGASDYVMKKDLARLAPGLRRALAEAALRAAHRETQRKLAESEERFRSLTAMSSDFYWESDEEHRLTERVAGHRPSHVVEFQAGRQFGKRRWEVPHLSPDEEGWGAHRADLEAHRPFRDFELSRPGADNGARFISLSGEPVFDATGAFRGYRGVGTDITERKRAEAALAATTERLRLVVESSPLAIYTRDGEGRLTGWNGAAERMSGWPAAQVLGKRLPTLFDTAREELDWLRQELRAGDTAASLEAARSRRDGTRLRLEAFLAPLPDAAGGGHGLIAVVTDITARFLAEEKVRRLSRVQAVLSGINALIVRARDRDELFQGACRIAVETGGLSFAWLGLVDEAAQRLRPAASAGLDGGFLARLGDGLSLREEDPDGQGAGVRAVRSGAPVVHDVEDIASPTFRKLHAQRGMKAFAAFPLLSEGRAVGAFCLHAAETGFFDADEVRLLAEVAGNIAFALDRLEKSEKVAYLAAYDALTGLPRQGLLRERLAQHLGGAQPVALVVLDVERFRAVNEAHGREAGDALLKEIARRLSGCVGAEHLARLGMDRFAAILPDVADPEGAARRVDEGLKRCFGEPFMVAGEALRIWARAGVALGPADGRDPESLQRNAEAALKKAKAGGERYLFYAGEMNERAAEKLALEGRLRRAVENGELLLHYQPKVDLETGRLTGLEALMRWASPELGLVAPAKFIGVLEETGLILEAGAWALERAARDHRAWTEAGLAPPRVAVNVSAIQLRQKDFAASVERAVMEGVAPTAIDLEITETLIMQDVQATIARLKEARSLGVRIAIDDFGTGYSSLAYLARLPVQALKIDRAFIAGMLEDPDATALVETMISLARSLRLKVVAEGVETEEQARMLRLLLCDEMQGYLYSKPLPLADMTALLRRERKAA